MLMQAEGSLCDMITQFTRAVGPTLLALPALKEMTEANAKATEANVTAIQELTMATKANAAGIQELGVQLGVVWQEVGACAVLKPIVDDIRYCQLSKICEDIERVDTGVTWLDTKFSEGLDMVNIRVDKLISAHASPPQDSGGGATPSRGNMVRSPGPPPQESHPTSTAAPVRSDHIDVASGRALSSVAVEDKTLRSPGSQQVS
jgi:hypothetical protein